jgi:hypothetical protein
MYILHCTVQCTLYIFPDFSKFIEQVKDDMSEADVTPVNIRGHVYVHSAHTELTISV